MRKVITLLLTTFFLVSCNLNSPISERPGDDGNYANNDFTLEYVDDLNIHWDDTTTDVSEYIPITPEMAVKIADVIFEAWMSPEELSEHTTVVYMQKEPHIAKILKLGKKVSLSHNCCVAIDMETGELLKIWNE